MQKQPIVVFLVVLAVVASGCLDGSEMNPFQDDEEERLDSDGDGVGDNDDAFPNDANESADSDGDGIGDNEDAFPNDASETVDSDDDGVGDNEDAFPNNADETADSDGDGVGDNEDAFPNDASETVDSDGDGVGDNAEASLGTNPNTPDSDTDGLTDYEEISVYFTNPVAADTDQDGLDDYSEIFGWSKIGFTWMTDPLSADSDSDGVPDNADFAPTGNAIVHVLYTRWSAPDQAQDFWSEPDPWLRTVSSEGEDFKIASWDNQVIWVGEYEVEFDLEDSSSSLGIAIEFYDSDSPTTENPEVESSQIMDINEKNSGSSAEAQRLVLFYNLWNNYNDGIQTVTGDVDSNGVHSTDAADGLPVYSVVTIEQDGNNDGDTTQFDCYISFTIWWESEGSIETDSDFFTSDEDGDRIPDFQDYNDGMDVGVTINIEEFGLADQVDSDGVGEVFMKIYVDEQQIAWVGDGSETIPMETGHYYYLDKAYFIDLDDRIRYHSITIAAWESDGFWGDERLDIDGNSVEGHALNLLLDTHTGYFSGDDSDGIIDGRDDGNENYDADAVLIYSITLTDTAERGVDKMFEWTFNGNSYQYSVELDPDTYYDFKELDHILIGENDWPAGYTRFVTPNEEYIVEIASDLNSMAINAGFNDEETVNFVLRFVQTIDYAFDNATTGFNEYPKYPIEMLWEGQGDCEDASALFASLMEAMGFDAIFILAGSSSDPEEELPGLNHAIIGVHLDGISGSYFEFEGVSYFICETTGVGPTLGHHYWEQLIPYYIYQV